MKSTPGSLEDRVRAGTPVVAPPEQLAQVVRFSDALRSRRPSRCQLIGPAGERLDVPEAVFHVIVKVAEVMAKGDAVTVVPVGKELTTQQAALLLNVSRQYLVRLLDQGVLPYRKTGKHRRLRVEDVLAYRERRDRERRADLDELSRYTEEIGGYNRE